MPLRDCTHGSHERSLECFRRFGEAGWLEEQRGHEPFGEDKDVDAECGGTSCGCTDECDGISVVRTRLRCEAETEHGRSFLLEGRRRNGQTRGGVALVG